MKGGMREKVELATKFGITFHGKIEMHGDPGYVRAACESSLKQLGIDCIDLYYQHRVDIRVPIEVTVRPLVSSFLSSGKFCWFTYSTYARVNNVQRFHLCFHQTDFVYFAFQCHCISCFFGTEKLQILTQNLLYVVYQMGSLRKQQR